MEKITDEILLILNKKWNYEIKAKFGKSYQILLGDFITGIISYNSAKETCNFLNISPQTFNRTIKKLFPNVKLTGGGQTWAYYLLNLSKYKKCHICDQIKERIEFGKNLYTIDKLHHSCKKCKSNTNKQYYAIRKDIWDNYYDDHKQEYIARNALRRTKLLERTPKWGQEGIKEFYKNCPPEYHVDHIIPLQGKYVSGLHVLDNLQYLSGAENSKKSNKYDASMMEW